MAIAEPDSSRASRDMPIPADWSVSQALAAFLSENGFTTEHYNEPTFPVTVFGINWRIPNPDSHKVAIRFHDLHHVVTGFGTDLRGEAEISAWEIRRGVGAFPGFYVKGLVISIALFGLIHSPLKTVAAWRRAKSETPLLKICLQRYGEILDMNVGELRALYDLPTGGIAGPRQLHAAAPV